MHGRAEGPTYQAIEEPETKKLADPVRIDPEGLDWFAWNRPWENPETFILEGQDLRLEPVTTSIITQDHVLLGDLSKQHSGQLSQHPVWQFHRLAKAQRVPGHSLVLATKGAHNNYFHWMTMLLNRWRLWELSGKSLEAIDQIVVNAQQLPFQTETLAHLLPENHPPLLFTPPDKQLVERATIPSLPYQDGACRRDALEWTRARFLSANKSPPDLRLYITREDAQTRRVVNEAALWDALQARGFQKITLSHHSVREQAELFAQAACVIGPHGAGLTNLLFSPPHTRVIEFFAVDYYSSVFWWISTILDQKYAYLASEPDPSGKPWPKNDIFISLPKFLPYLDRQLEA